MPRIREDYFWYFFEYCIIEKGERNDQQISINICWSGGSHPIFTVNGQELSNVMNQAIRMRLVNTNPLQAGSPQRRTPTHPRSTGPWNCRILTALPGMTANLHPPQSTHWPTSGRYAQHQAWSTAQWRPFHPDRQERQIGGCWLGRTIYGKPWILSKPCATV